MIARIVLGIALTVASVSTSTAQTAAREGAAQASAESFLALVDAGKYAESWQQAASAFKTAVSADQWAQAVAKARGPFGGFKSRKVTSRSYSTTLPGAPDGQYVVVVFESAFDHKAAAVETAVMTLDADGTWRVAGSFIK